MAEANFWTLKNLADRGPLTNRLTPGHPDAFLNALLDYTEGLFPMLKDAGLKPGEAADVMHHIERAARGLHSLAVSDKPQK